MNVCKNPGGVMPHSVSPEDLTLINQLSKTQLTEEQVYTFAIRLCDNEIDRDWERFDRNALETLRSLFVGKSGIFDHNWSAEGQTARLYKTEVCQEDGLTGAGDPCCFLKGFAYMLRNEKNLPLIQEIEAGIKKEVSVGCSVSGRKCSICGKDGCGHHGGETYDGKQCFFTLVDPVDAYEWSFVAVPAQRKAGVMKSFLRGADGDLRQLLSAHPACRKQWDALEKEARLGRSYLNGLRRELVRLAGLSDEDLDLGVFAKTTEKMEEDELLELTKVYKRRMEEIYPPQPQLKPQNAAPCGEEDRAFLI